MAQGFNTINRPWRIGKQVGRTLYRDSGTKDPADLFGMVDDKHIAEHIVEVHNWWLDQRLKGREGAMPPGLPTRHD